MEKYRTSVKSLSFVLPNLTDWLDSAQPWHSETEPLEEVEDGEEAAARARTEN